MYFKINVHKFFYKYPVFKQSTLLSHYFKDNLKMINTVYKENVNVFRSETSDGVLDYYCFLFFYHSERIFSYCENYFSVKY